MTVRADEKFHARPVVDGDAIHGKVSEVGRQVYEVTCIGDGDDVLLPLIDSVKAYIFSVLLQN